MGASAQACEVSQRRAWETSACPNASRNPHNNQTWGGPHCSPKSKSGRRHWSPAAAPANMVASCDTFHVELADV